MEMGGQFHLDLGGQFAWIFQHTGIKLQTLQYGWVNMQEFSANLQKQKK
jgi:hypothetical protein